MSDKVKIILTPDSTVTQPSECDKKIEDIVEVPNNPVHASYSFKYNKQYDNTYKLEFVGDNREVPPFPNPELMNIDEEKVLSLRRDEEDNIILEWKEKPNELPKLERQDSLTRLLINNSGVTSWSGVAIPSQTFVYRNITINTNHVSSNSVFFDDVEFVSKFDQPILFIGTQFASIKTANYNNKRLTLLLDDVISTNDINTKATLLLIKNASAGFTEKLDLLDRVLDDILIRAHKMDLYGKPTDISQIIGKYHSFSTSVQPIELDQRLQYDNIPALTSKWIRFYSDTFQADRIIGKGTYIESKLHFNLSPSKDYKISFFLVCQKPDGVIKLASKEDMFFNISSETEYTFTCFTELNYTVKPGDRLGFLFKIVPQENDSSIEIIFNTSENKLPYFNIPSVVPGITGESINIDNKPLIRDGRLNSELFETFKNHIYHDIRSQDWVQQEDSWYQYVFYENNVESCTVYRDNNGIIENCMVDIRLLPDRIILESLDSFDGYFVIV